MRTTITIAIAAILGATLSPAEAVTLNPRGTGQVLIYPYYTVNAGFSTLLSVVNTTAQGKALKVHIREGHDGRDVLIFNLYLSPYDAWVAQIFDLGSGSGGAAIATNDNSCTVPTFPPVGAGAAAFRDAGYTGANADGGPTGITRTREGYIEIIEMGTVTNDHHSTLSAITHGTSGVPSSCPQLLQAWTAGGYWTTEANTDIGVPTGGLYGAESIINVGEGLIYAVNAEAIDGFSAVAQHAPPGNATPDLGSASKSGDGTVSAFVPVGSGMVEAKYDHPEDAISALFMADNLYNEFVIAPGVGARSDWIVALPTKRFYTDPALIDASGARLPFDEKFGSHGGASCSPIRRVLADRDGMESAAGDCGFICPTLPFATLCYATNALEFANGSGLGSNLTYPVMIDHVFGPTTGHLRIDLTSGEAGGSESNHVLTSGNGLALRGLPAIGFLAVDYINANSTPGVLANYSGVYRHKSTVACSSSANAPATCP